MSNLNLDYVKEIVEFDVIEYMKWAEDFTKKYSEFSVNDWDYDVTSPCLELDKDDIDAGITSKDIYKINVLNLFYLTLDECAQHLYIYPIPMLFGKYYIVKYNEKLYKVSCYKENYSFSIFDDNASEYINIEDIVSPSDQAKERAIKIKNEVQKIGELFNDLIKDGVPYQAIKKASNVVISKFEENKN